MNNFDKEIGSIIREKVLELYEGAETSIAKGFNNKDIIKIKKDSITFYVWLGDYTTNISSKDGRDILYIVNDKGDLFNELIELENQTLVDKKIGYFKDLIDKYIKREISKEELKLLVERM